MLEAQLHEAREFAKNVDRELCVLKLGGSVITEKSKPMMPNLEAIERLAAEIASAKLKNLVIIHGGGSFGHPLAKKYEIRQGFKNESQIEGFIRTHQAMLTLNSLIVETLISYNVAAMPLPPSSCIITRAGRIEEINQEIPNKFLDMHFTPVLFGDAVLDRTLGFTILSGDQIAANLAIRLKAERMILGVDVDGLHTANPRKHASSILIPKLTLRGVKAIISNIEPSTGNDVTGGMLGKIQEILPAIEAGIQTIIVNAAKENYIYKTLKKQRVVSTVIEK